MKSFVVSQISEKERILQEVEDEMNKKAEELKMLEVKHIALKGALEMGAAILKDMEEVTEATEAPKQA